MSRTCLTQDTTFYANPFAVPTQGGVDGSLTLGVGSANPCDPTNPSTPFATGQQAADFLKNQIDTEGHTATINYAHGFSKDYALTLYGMQAMGSATFSIVGDRTNPGAVGIIAPNGNYGIFAKDLAWPSISSIVFGDEGASPGAIYAGQYGLADLRSCTIGPWNAGAGVLNAVDNGRINMLGPDQPGMPTNAFTGTSYNTLFEAQMDGSIDFNNLPIQLAGPLTVTGWFIFAYSGRVRRSQLLNAQGQPYGTVFTGTGAANCTGKKCYWMNSSMFGVDPNTIFPGNQAGTVGSQAY